MTYDEIESLQLGDIIADPNGRVCVVVDNNGSQNIRIIPLKSALKIEEWTLIKKTISKSEQ